MVCEMETDQMEDMEMEVLPSMWPEDIGSEIGKQFNVEKPAGDQDTLKEVTFKEKPTIADLGRLSELIDSTDQGSSQLANLVKQWEYMQANASRLLREELDNLSRQREEAEAKELKIIEEHQFEDESKTHPRQVLILDNMYDLIPNVPQRNHDAVVQSKRIEIDADYDTVAYWKQRALHLEKMLEASTRREQVLLEKLQESIKNLESHSAPVEELTQNLKRAEGFLHFILQNAPVVMGHQDMDLRYLFIYNKFPGLREQDILGKTDIEIFSGAGVKESQDFKKEVLEIGRASKREITFETELFGSKTFLIYVEPVYNKAGEKIGINYMGMEVTEQVRKREKMAKLREDKAVRKAMESELNKTIHITEETMRAKQVLATMSHEIRSPLSGVVGMAEILSTTKLDHEQRQLLDVMISSGDLVLQLINDILDLSKVESGVMRLEATQFRPREVVKHALQMAAASLKKALTLEGHIAEDVPIEVVGDVLRIRQILTNLISNAIKFTHEGRVGIKLEVIPEPSFASEVEQGNPEEHNSFRKEHQTPKHAEKPYQNQPMGGEAVGSIRNGNSVNGDAAVQADASDRTVWIRCDVYDTGIGIPENAIPSLFKKYMQASADHARKYGGTGLGLAICKQLVELMGGSLTVTSRVNVGSTFTFILPYKVSTPGDNFDDPDEFSDMVDNEAVADDTTEGFFQFKPRMGSLYSSSRAAISQDFLPHKILHATPLTLNGLPDDCSYAFSSNKVGPIETAAENVSCMVETADGPKISSNHCPGSAHKFVNGEIEACQKDNSQCQILSRESEYRINLQANSQDSIMVMETEPAVSDARQGKPETSSQETSTSSQGSSKTNSKPKILLVEDNRINVMVTQSMMKQLGHSIDVVNNGIEAINAVQRSCYDLVLMDVCMPVLDGLTATKLIRSFEETGNWDAAIQAGIDLTTLPSDTFEKGQVSNRSMKRLPIIAMTANALSESAEECYANGMDSFISKPVTFQKLKGCLEQYFP